MYGHGHFGMNANSSYFQLSGGQEGRFQQQLQQFQLEPEPPQLPQLFQQQQPPPVSVGRPYKCEACDIWSGSYEIWVSHLSSEGHQLRVTSRSQGNKINPHGHEQWAQEESLREKSLIVSGLRGVPVSNFIRYLSKWGNVLELIRQEGRGGGPTDAYFVLYDSPESALRVLEAQKRAPHEIQRQRIFFRRKYDRASQQQQNFPPPVSVGGQILRNPGAVMVSSQPQLYNQNQGQQFYRRPEGGNRSALDVVASQYRDESETALGSLMSTYAEDSENEEHHQLQVPQHQPRQQQHQRISQQHQRPPPPPPLMSLQLREKEKRIEAPKVPESSTSKGADADRHDLFSRKMAEYLATTLAPKKLHDQFDGFCKSIILSAPFLEARFKLIRELLEILKTRYPKCAIYPCGPDYVGVGNSDDSVNVFVDLFDNQLCAEKYPWETSKTHHIPEIYQLLKLEEDRGRFCKNVIKKPKKGPPNQISLSHLQSQVEVSIRTQEFTQVQESMLIKFLCTLDPRVRPLIVLVRYWASFYHILETPAEEDKRTRLVVLLMIFHLTNRKVIPSLNELQAKEHTPTIYENNDISFCGDRSKLPPCSLPKVLIEDKSILTLSTLSLLKDFFQRFGVANLKENAVCLSLGRFIVKKHLEVGQEKHLPAELKRTLRVGFDGTKRDKILDVSGGMCILDLFNVGLNLGVNLGEKEVKSFQLQCWNTSEKLEEILNSSSPYLMDLFISSTEELVQQKEREKEIENREQQKAAEARRRTEAEKAKAARNLEIQRREVEVQESRWEKPYNKYSEPEEKEEIRPPRREIPPVDPQREEMFNLEWEEFSRSLEQQPVVRSLLPPTRYGRRTPAEEQNARRPIAPVAPSFKPARPSTSSNAYSEYDQYGNSSLVAKPLRYNQDRSNEMISSADEEDDDDEDSDGANNPGDDEDEAMEDAEQSALMKCPSSIRSPFAQGKSSLRQFMKDFFMEAVEGKDFSYGVRGKLQALYLQFMKDFNNRFWTSVMGFELELDPPYQLINVIMPPRRDDVYSANYQNLPPCRENCSSVVQQIKKNRANSSVGIFGQLKSSFLFIMENLSPADYGLISNGSYRQTLTQILMGVPVHEDNFEGTFFCRSSPMTHPLITSTPIKRFRDGKFVRKSLARISSRLKIEIKDKGAPLIVGDSNAMRFKVHFGVELDYRDLNVDCCPSATITFEKPTDTTLLPKLTFLGKVYNRMAVQFVNDSFRGWLDQATDFDLKAADKRGLHKWHEANRQKNLKRKELEAQGIFSRKKRAKMERKERLKEERAANKANAMAGFRPEAAPASFMTSVRGGLMGRRGGFQVPPGWNRTMNFDPAQPPQGQGQGFAQGSRVMRNPHF